MIRVKRLHRTPGTAEPPSSAGQSQRVANCACERLIRRCVRFARVDAGGQGGEDVQPGTRYTVLVLGSMEMLAQRS